jgi:hypothetical protein
MVETGIQFPPGLELFCIPDGLHLYSAPALPRIHYFACQALNGDRLYGICLTFFEQVGPELLAKLKVYDPAEKQSPNSINNNSISKDNSTTSAPNTATTPSPILTPIPPNTAPPPLKTESSGSANGSLDLSFTNTSTSPYVSDMTYFPDDTQPLRPRGTAFTISTSTPTLSTPGHTPTSVTQSASSDPISKTPSTTTHMNANGEGQPPVVPKRPILGTSSGSLSTPSSSPTASTTASPAKGNAPSIPPRPPTGATVPVTAASIQAAAAAATTTGGSGHHKTHSHSFSSPNRVGVATGSGSHGGVTPMATMASPSSSTSRQGSHSTASTPSSLTSPPKKTPKQAPIYAPKCIGLLSHFPFLAQFRQFLTEMYRLSITPSKVPLERLLCNFMQEGNRHFLPSHDSNGFANSVY